MNLQSAIKEKRDSHGKYIEIYLTGDSFYTAALINNFNQLLMISQEPLPNKQRMTELVKDTFIYIQQKINPYVSILAPLNLDIYDGVPVFIARLIAH